MKLKLNFDARSIHQLIGVVVLGLLYAFWISFGKDRLYWEGMHSVFRYSAEYIQETWNISNRNIPNGFLYINRFTQQFLIVPWLGALVMVGLSALNYVLIKGLLVKCNFSGVAAQYLALIPILGTTVYLFFLLSYGRFMLLAVLPFFYGAIAGYLNIKHTPIRIVFGLLALWILPFLVGIWSVGFAILMLLYEWKTLDKISVWLLVFSVVLGSVFLPPYIWQHTIFTRNYLTILTAVPFSINSWKTFGAMLFAALPWLVVLAAQLFPNFKNLFKSWIIYPLLALTIFGCSFVLATNQEVKLFNLFCRIENKVEHRDWEGVLEACDKYLYLTEIGNDKGFFYAWVIDNTKFALVHTGRLLEDFFSYTRYEGFGILFSQNLGFFDMSHSGIYNFFSDIGLQSEAIRSTYNRIAFGGETVFSLKRLIESSLIAGDYRPAIQVNNTLSGSLFFRKQVRYFRELLEDTAKLNHDPFFVQRRKLLPKEDFTVSRNIDLNILNLWLSNTQNQRAGEYVVAMALSAKQHTDIMPTIEFLLENFRYRYIPRHIEEAIIVHVISNVENVNIDPREYLLTQKFGGLRIRQETIARIDNFFHWMNRFQNGQITFREFEDAFGDTYWFHVLFIQTPPPEGVDQSFSYAV